MTDELKACPKCGKNKASVNYWDEYFRYECQSCHYSPDSWSDTEEQARQYWNARPLEDALLERAENAEWMVERLIKAGSNVRWLIASAADADVICAMDDFDDLADEWNEQK